MYDFGNESVVRGPKPVRHTSLPVRSRLGLVITIRSIAETNISINRAYPVNADTHYM